MPWRIGIDEAGYGPNLGPFVMTAVGCQISEDLVGADLWHALSASTRRAKGKSDARLAVDDSKLVYSSTRGLADLERTVLSLLGVPGRLGDLLRTLAPSQELSQECWFHGDSKLPLACETAAIRAAATEWRVNCAEKHVSWTLLRSEIVCTGQFNEIVERTGTKGAVLARCLVSLIQAAMASASAEPMEFFIDKHGGRNQYGSILQHAFADGWVLPIAEGMAKSVYEVRGLDRPVRVTILPRADSGHFEVALASMVSKYLREALMGEFNDFWKMHISDLTPTAGYPVDATRFLHVIRPALVRLGIPEDKVWRQK